mmetsp:Transcript_85419/g.242245  ORF Transcript_85419/g.242245 Transcript_85419/m.242245 type:complete len:469 (-) Transcript_85419:832-2238(-)
MVATTHMSMMIRTMIEKPMLDASTFTGALWAHIMLYMSHGSGSPTVTSKMLEPIELLTAMSPSPFLATIQLDSRSGMEVPAASTVTADTSGGIPMVKLMTTIHSYKQFANAAIHTSEMRNSMIEILRSFRLVSPPLFLFSSSFLYVFLASSFFLFSSSLLCFRTSGTVQYIAAHSGYENRYQNQLLNVLSFPHGGSRLKLSSSISSASFWCISWWVSPKMDFKYQAWNSSRFTVCPFASVIRRGSAGLSSSSSSSFGPSGGSLAAIRISSMISSASLSDTPLCPSSTIKFLISLTSMVPLLSRSNFLKTFSTSYSILLSLAMYHRLKLSLFTIPFAVPVSRRIAVSTFVLSIFFARPRLLRAAIISSGERKPSSSWSSLVKVWSRSPMSDITAAMPSVSSTQVCSVRILTMPFRRLLNPLRFSVLRPSDGVTGPLPLSSSSFSGATFELPIISLSFFSILALFFMKKQ